MTIETSTLNVLLTAVVALQCWIIRELFRIKSRLSIVLSKCPHCQKRIEEPAYE